MDKYSSDSDSKSIHRNNKKSHLRICQDRSSSSDSSSSRTRRRKNKKHRRDRSRSKGTDTFSKFRNEGSRYKNSPDRSTRSLKDRYRSKHKSFNSSFNRSRSISRDRKTKKSESRESSRHRDKSDNSSSSNSCSEKISRRFKEIKTDKVTDANVQMKLKLKKELLETDNTKINADILGEINDDAFVPKQFVSAKMSSNIVIDLKSQIIKMPDVEITEPDSIFHPNLFTNEETRMEKWAKELYVYRQKIVNSDLNI